MKRAQGTGFSVRFTRRGIGKSVAACAAAANESVVQDLPMEEQPVQQTNPLIDAPIISPANKAKEKMLREAAKAGDCAVIRILVMEGVDLDARDSTGRTALNIATQYNQKDAITTLLAAREMRRMAKLEQLPDTDFYKKFKPPERL